MIGIRKQVMAEMAKVAADAINRGEDVIQAVETAFPGVPTSVAAEAWCEADMNATEAWWQTVERTIDGELVRRGIEAAKPDGSP